MNICREIPNLVKIGQKYQALYMKSQVRFIVAGNIKLPRGKSALYRVKWYKAGRMAKEV